MTALQPGISGDHRIGDAVVDAIKDAADSAGVVDDAVGLSTLENGDSLELPIHPLTLPFNVDAAKNFGNS